MNAIQRQFKKMSIIMSILLVLGAIAFILTRPKQEPCFDGKQNNHEEGVDCGGLCAKQCPLAAKPEDVKNISIKWVKFVRSGANTYDLVALISNENTNWGVASLNYKFTYYNENGLRIGEKTGKTFVAPKGAKSGESVKYIIENNMVSDTQIDRVDLSLGSYDWKKIEEGIEIEDRNEDSIGISNASFQVDSMTKIYTATGKTQNESRYDFDTVTINVVVFDKDGGVIAASKTNQRTLKAGDGWGFAVIFPNLTVDRDKVASVDYRAETDVFDEKNFLKEYRAE